MSGVFALKNQSYAKIIKPSLDDLKRIDWIQQSSFLNQYLSGRWVVISLKFCVHLYLNISFITFCLNTNLILSPLMNSDSYLFNSFLLWTKGRLLLDTSTSILHQFPKYMITKSRLLGWGDPLDVNNSASLVLKSTTFRWFKEETYAFYTNVYLITW